MFKYLFILMYFVSVHTHAAPVRIASDIWCPYICENQTGYVVELTRRAFEIQGKTVEFRSIPYKRALIELQKNNIDAVLAVTPNVVEDDQLITEDVVVGYNTNDFYTIKENKKNFTHIGELINIHQVAVVKGYAYGDALNEWLQSQPNTYFATGTDPLAMNIIRLVKGRHSVIIDNKNVIEYTARQLNLNKRLRYAGTMGSPIPLLVGFNQQNKANAATFAAGIDMLKANGEYLQIINKYKILPNVTSEQARHKNLQKFLPTVN